MKHSRGVIIKAFESSWLDLAECGYLHRVAHKSCHGDALAGMSCYTHWADFYSSQQLSKSQEL